MTSDHHFQGSSKLVQTFPSKLWIAELVHTAMSDPAALRKASKEALEQAAAAIESELVDLEERSAACRRMFAQAAGAAVNAEIEAELAALQASMQHCCDMLRGIWRVHISHSRGPAPTAPPPVPVLDPAPTTTRHPNPVRRGKTVRIRERILELLRIRGSLHRAELLKLLVADGILGTEQKPMNRLASILSENTDLFSSDGRGNYSLIGTEQPRQPPREIRAEMLYGAEGQTAAVPINIEQKESSHATAA